MCAENSLWKIVIFFYNGKANHCGLLLPSNELADNSLLGARIISCGHASFPRGEPRYYPISLKDQTKACHFLKQPGKLSEAILAMERGQRGWHLTADAPDFIRTIRSVRSVNTDDMNCVEWIARALEVGGVHVPLSILTPSDLHFWCEKGFPKQIVKKLKDPKVLFKDMINMMGLLRELGPLPRTLACFATDLAFKKIKSLLPEAEIEGYPTGKKVWSWKIPERWELIRATLKDGKRVILDSQKSHLHCMNYSDSFKGRVSRRILLEHLHSDPARPSAIPFKFSFYQRKWGLCIQHEALKELKSKYYNVCINSKRTSGKLHVMSAFLPGKYTSEFLICCNICHPCQVNDSLTGLVVGIDIFKRLAQRKKRKYSYRLLVVPETIGSIAYMAHHPEVVENSVGGFFSEMLGTEGSIVLQKTRQGNSYWDKISEMALMESGKAWEKKPFMKSAANDEKCLDAPGVNIPVFSVTRFPYIEYHSDFDNIKIVKLDRLQEARDILQRTVDIIEQDYIPVLNQPGPIFLSGNNLMPKENKHCYKTLMESYYDVMYAIDGKTPVTEIAYNAKRPLKQIVYWTDRFASKKLLHKNTFIKMRSIN